MPAKSDKQRRMFAIAEHAPEKLHTEHRGLQDLSHRQLHEFAATKGLQQKQQQQRVTQLPGTKPGKEFIMGFGKGGYAKGIKGGGSAVGNKGSFVNTPATMVSKKGLKKK